MRWLIGALTCLAAGAQAQVRYTPQTVAGLPLAVPAGWTVSQTQAPVPTIKIEAKPGAHDAPSVIIMRVPAQPGAARWAQQFVQAAMPAGARAMGQQTGADGSVMTQWQGAINQIPARMAVIHRTDAQGGVVAAFAAPIQRYAALGGANLLMTVLSGKADATPTPAAQRAEPLTVPPAYAQRKKPILDWLADAIETIPPAQVAAGIRRMNPTERQLLGVYSAFANLVHFRACQADPSVRLPDGASCQATALGWRNTLQLVGGDVGRAIEEAERQRATLQIAARCDDGRTDAASCAAYRKTMSNISAMQHRSMMRIIANMGENTCVVGDPGCTPH